MATSSVGNCWRHREGIAVNRVVQFREKPDRATAERFLAAGNFAWNSGIFLWKARTILDELQRHRPELAAALARVGEALGTPAERDVIALEYPRMERAPIDKAVMEKAANVRVLEVRYDWNDVGDWRSLADLLPQIRRATPSRAKSSRATHQTRSSSPTMAG